MEAKHGLAADLGVASVNRLDAGACSCALLFGAAVGALERRQPPAPPEQTVIRRPLVRAGDCG